MVVLAVGVVKTPPAVSEVKTAGGRVGMVMGAQRLFVNVSREEMVLV